MTIKGSLQVSIPIVKAFLREIFIPVENGRKFAVFGEKWLQNVKCFRDPPKGTSLRETAPQRARKRLVNVYLTSSLNV